MKPWQIALVWIATTGISWALVIGLAAALFLIFESLSYLFALLA